MQTNIFRAEQVYGWGLNANAELGYGKNGKGLFPVSVSSLSHISISTIACGAEHTMALTDSGTIFVWGNSTFGQMGNGTIGDDLITTPLVLEYFIDQKIRSISCKGCNHILVLTENGQVYSWGCNETGQLGLNSLDACFSSPMLIQNDYKVEKIYAGGDGPLGLSYLISETGNLYGCGHNDQANLGLGDTEQRISFHCVDIPHLVMDIAIGADTHVIALCSDNNFQSVVYSWGNGYSNQLGYEADLQTSPRMIPQLHGIIKIAAGKNFSLFLTTQHEVLFCGQMVIGERVQVPTQIITQIKDIDTGTEHVILLREDEKILSFGCNTFGQLGTGSRFHSDFKHMQFISSISCVKKIIAGGSHTFALV
jgi:alpha-tubulin suppressor-like RCC1 family protein